MATDKVITMKELFNKKLSDLITTKADNSSFITREKYNALKKRILELKTKSTNKTPSDYRKLKHYDVIKVDNCKKLICPTSETNSTIKYFICIDEIFDIIHETHSAIGHGGRNRMMNELRKKYKNVTSETVMLYLNLCEVCQKRVKTAKKADEAIVPEEFNEINSRCHVDLIDMQKLPDKEFKFILLYQDYLTKFVLLRPLKSDQIEEVTNVLLDIFSVFGAPCVLQSDNERQFSKSLVDELCSKWSELKIVHGKPRFSKQQCTSHDIKNLVMNWMEASKTCYWHEGLRFIQLMKNKTYNEEIICSPFEAVFRSPMKLGLRTSALPFESVSNLQTEEELDKIISDLTEKDEDDGDITDDAENYSDYL